MPFTRTKLFVGMAAVAVAANSIGCLAPWPDTLTKGEAFRRPAAMAAATPAVPLPIPENSNGDAAPEMAGVLDKLEQVRALDPTAEPKLLEELRRTPPNSWPLVAEQFRATLAYRQQLAAKEQTPPRDGESMADSRRAPSASAMLESALMASKPPAPAGLGPNHERPSTRIGALVDPHVASAESATVLAQSMLPTVLDPAEKIAASPAADAAPAAFAGSGPMSPIEASGGATVELADFQTPPDATHVATQALAIVETRGAIGSTPSMPIDTLGSSAKAPGGQAPTTEESWQQLVQKAANDLSQRVAASPATTAEVHQHVSLRMLRLLSGDTERALEPIPHISPAEQDYWSRQMFALATYLDHHSQPDDKRRAAASVVHLDEAVSHLRELGSLSLRNFSFCKNVYGYGAIEPYEVDTFAPGQQVSLYVEVENYHSASNEKGYCTLLGATYELLDDKGKRVSGGEFPDVDDCCRSRRRDFHIQFGLAMPANLTPGRYRLELVVKDRQSDKLGHATAPFEIRAGRK